MPLKFDATLKDLAEGNPPGWVATFDRPPDVPVMLLNVDLSTVTTSADLVFGLGDALREILHFDAQSSAAAVKHLDILVYNALLHRLYRVPVHSVLLLLRPQAAHSNQTGAVTYEGRPGRSKMEFGYEIIRLWEVPVERLLTGSIDMTPLAPLGQLPQGVPAEDAMADVIRRIVERIWHECAPDRARLLLTSAFLLTGMRVPKQRLGELFMSVEMMRDSSAYQLILDEGSVKTLRSVLLRQGTIRFGPPSEAIRTAVNAISTDDLERLERMSERILDVGSWQELLGIS